MIGKAFQEGFKVGTLLGAAGGGVGINVAVLGTLGPEITLNGVGKGVEGAKEVVRIVAGVSSVIGLGVGAVGVSGGVGRISAAAEAGVGGALGAVAGSVGGAVATAGVVTVVLGGFVGVGRSFVGLGEVIGDLGVGIGKATACTSQAALLAAAMAIGAIAIATQGATTQTPRALAGAVREGSESIVVRTAQTVTGTAGSAVSITRERIAAAAARTLTDDDVVAAVAIAVGGTYLVRDIVGIANVLWQVAIGADGV